MDARVDQQLKRLLKRCIIEHGCLLNVFEHTESKCFQSVESKWCIPESFECIAYPKALSLLVVVVVIEHDYVYMTMYIKAGWVGAGWWRRGWAGVVCVSGRCECVCVCVWWWVDGGGRGLDGMGNGGNGDGWGRGP